MTDPDDEVELLLRERRIAPASDGGFSGRVMAQLPARATPRRWIVPTLTAVGLLLALPSLHDTRVLSALAELADTSNIYVAPAVGGLLAWSACLWALLAEQRSRI